ncbi:DUF6090 family protein [Robiginitalea sp. IMCC44478]|uniref:DUF6090 family protein n=1 Tax=Robiginitalea sp. IMCC44478 TaxID=3459122 RepID=UPI004040ED36
MIKFFRKIRQQLLSENKTGKYLIYAFGEIVLVVIGILIALQINNWKENNENSIFEGKVIAELSVDVSEDLKEMSSALDSLKASQRSSIIIENLIENKKEYHDSLNKHFASALRLWSLSPNNTAFEMAKEEGMYFITNDSIRFYSSKLNGYLLDYIRVLEDRFENYKSAVVLPHIQPLFNSYGFSTMRPINYDELIEDHTYLSIIRSIFSMRARYINALNIRYKWTGNLDSLIKEEMAKSNI